MNSQYDDLTGKRDVQNFLKMIKEKNDDDRKFDGFLEKMSPTGKKVNNFLEGQKLAQNFNNPAGLPQDLYEAIMRQYGKEEFGPYTTDDMKLIQQYNQGLI